MDLVWALGYGPAEHPALVPTVAFVGRTSVRRRLAGELRMSPLGRTQIAQCCLVDC